MVCTMMQLTGCSAGAGKAWPGCPRVTYSHCGSPVWICKTGRESMLPSERRLSLLDLFSQVEPNTKLFPAVFVLPTHQNVVQFELGKQKARRQGWVQAKTGGVQRVSMEGREDCGSQPTLSSQPTEHHAAVSRHVPE